MHVVLSFLNRLWLPTLWAPLAYIRALNDDLLSTTTTVIAAFVFLYVRTYIMCIGEGHVYWTTYEHGPIY